MNRIWLSLIGLCLMCQSLFAQEVLRGHLLFASGEYALNSQHEHLLITWLDSLQQLEWKVLTIEAHTDTFGSIAYNQKLSEQRAASVRQFLLEKGVDSQLLKVTYFGEERGAARSKDPDEQHFDRRVDLVATLSETAEVDLYALYRSLRGGYQFLRASMRRDTTLRTANGMILCLRTHSFLKPNGQVYRGPVELRIMEANGLGERIRYNLAQDQAPNDIYEPTHVLEIRAKGRAGNLRLNPKVPITVMLPIDSVHDSLRISVAKAQGRQALHWTNLHQRKSPSGDPFIQVLAGQEVCQEWPRAKHYQAHDYSWAQRTKLKIRRLLTGRVYEKGHWVTDPPSPFRKGFQQRYGAFSCSMLAKASQANQRYYAFNLGAVGWVSCEHPHRAAAERIDFAVSLPTAAGQTDIKLVLKDSNSILTGERSNDRITFRHVPLGRSAQVIGLRVNGASSGFALEETVITPGLHPAPTFEAMSLQSLKQRLSQL